MAESQLHSLCPAVELATSCRNNAGPQAPPIAGATQERRLLAVACTPSLGPDLSPRPPCPQPAPRAHRSGAWPAEVTSRELSAPVELVQGAGVSLPSAHIGVRPTAASGTRQIHAVDLEPGLCRCACDLRRLSRRVLDGLQPRLGDASHSDRGIISPLDLDFLGAGRQPLRYHRVPQRRQVAAFVAAEDGLQLATLVGASGLIDVHAQCAVAAEEVARPFTGNNNFGASEIDAVRVTISDVEREGAGA